MENAGKTERTKKTIIEKTAAIFNTKGFAGTSLTDLTTATGLSKGSIYGNFLNKDEVALAAFDFNYGQILSYIREKIRQETTIIKKLLVYPKVYRKFLEIPFLKSGCPILNTAVEADDTHPLLRRKAAEAHAYWKQSLERHLKCGIKAGEIDPSTPVKETAATIISIIEGAIMQAKLTGRPEELRLSMKFLEKMIRSLDFRNTDLEIYRHGTRLSQQRHQTV